VHDVSFSHFGTIGGWFCRGIGLAGALKEKVMVSKKDCRKIIRHQPAADVAYKPDVDVRGRPVKSADFDGGRQIQLLAVIAISLHVPLGNRLKRVAARLWLSRKWAWGPLPSTARPAKSCARGSPC